MKGDKLITRLRILAAASDAGGDFFAHYSAHYDRREDEDLRVKELRAALMDGTVTLDELATAFVGSAVVDLELTAEEDFKASRVDKVFSVIEGLLDWAMAAGRWPTRDALLTAVDAVIAASTQVRVRALRSTPTDLLNLLSEQTFTFGNDVVRMSFALYGNRRLRIDLVTVPDENGMSERYATLTVNLPGFKLDEGEFFVKTWSENAPLLNTLLESGVFVDTGRKATIRPNYTVAAVWKFSPDWAVAIARDFKDCPTPRS